MDCASTNYKPALKGDSSRARPVGDAARGESGGIGSIASSSEARRPYSNQRCGCECNEQPEGLQRGFCCLRQPLSQSASRRIASSPAREPFGCGISSNPKAVPMKWGKWHEVPKGEWLKQAKCVRYSPSVCSLSFTDSSPASGGAFWCALQTLLHYACPERGGGCEQSEQTEGLHRDCSCLRQPLSQSALRRIASSPAGEPFGCDTICQDIRVNAQVGTRSPYSLPFVILPVPARSPFRLLVHRTRSTPNPIDKPPFSGL